MKEVPIERMVFFPSVFKAIPLNRLFFLLFAKDAKGILRACIILSLGAKIIILVFSVNFSNCCWHCTNLVVRFLLLL